MQTYREYSVEVEDFGCHEPLLVGKAVHDISKVDQKAQSRLHESDLVVQPLVPLRQLFIHAKVFFLYSQSLLQTSFLTTLSFYTDYLFIRKDSFFPSLFARILKKKYK